MKLLGIGSRIKHNEYGIGVITNVTSKYYWVTFIENGIETISFDEEIEIIEAVEDEIDRMSFNDVENVFKKLLEKYTDLTPPTSIADKWKGGKLILEPNNNTQNKEIPLETFFHKIVMVRDRMRVMEQKINSSNLDETEKVELQQYITRIYGSLTTFNVLFKHQSDYFVGEKSK